MNEMWLGGRCHFVVSVRDTTERKRAEEALQYQALYDSLTDLPNRTLLHDRLDCAVVAAQRGGSPLALLVVDLDRFKEVNDTLGHHYGDLLLQQVGRRLSLVLRASDTLARLGGDEFAILLPEADARDAALVVQRVLTALEPPLDLEGHCINIGASIGIAVYPDHGADADTLLRRADVAMYVAKRGGNSHAIYTFEQDQHSPSRLALVGELRKAIDDGELVLHYQPKQDFRSGRVICVEALVRWQHPQYGLMPPDRFLPTAEQTGLIRPLGLWVLNTALRQCHLWAEAGLDLKVAVNLSMRNLEDPELPAIIVGLLARWELTPDRLIVELTESSLMTDPARAERIVRALCELGVTISVDDFGTGYSSLAYLKRLAVGELKIDKSFVQHMAVDQNDAAIVRSTIGLGHDLRLSVVAEGVEDQHTWDLLAALDCDIAQGYYLSRPLTADELVRWLADSTVRPANSPALVGGVAMTGR